MNPLLILAESISSATSESSSGSGSGSSGGGSIASLKGIFTNPVLYIVLGAIVLLIIAFYLFRRMAKASPNATTIIVRKGKVYKVLDEKNPKYFMVPFVDSVGAVITNGDKTFASDKLFINNGPDALYKIDYVLTYKVLDPVAFYPYLNNLQNLLNTRINDELRLFADNGNALTLIKDYRTKSDEILAVLNKALEEYHIEVSEFKVNLIQPLGGH